jgi:hypothetical protein
MHLGVDHAEYGFYVAMRKRSIESKNAGNTAHVRRSGRISDCGISDFGI